MRADDLLNLCDLMAQRCIEKGSFTLASGLPAKYYYDGKFVTLSPREAKRLSSILLELVRQADAEAVGGMAVGSVPISQSIALASLEDGGREIPTFMVRPAPKDHGKRDQVSSAFVEHGKLLQPGRRVAIVDDVITTGGSVQGAIDAVEALGCQVVLVAVLVERHEHGGQKLADNGYNFQRLFWTDVEGNLSVDEGLLRRAENAAPAGVLR